MTWDGRDRRESPLGFAPLLVAHGWQRISGGRRKSSAPEPPRQLELDTESRRPQEVAL
jgi:hypothetical protein